MIIRNTNTPSGKNAEYFKVKREGTYNYHRALIGYLYITV
jgi:hypothetical protein